MSTKTPNQYPAWISQALMKKTSRWITVKGTHKGLGDNNGGGVLLRVEDLIFRPIWKNDIGGYLRGIKDMIPRS